MMEEKVLDTLFRHRMLQNNNVIVALSGGADSVALFHFLHTRRDMLGIRVQAAHFEHGLRGQESRREEEQVRRLCEACGAQLWVEHGFMAEREKPAGESGEEWARSLRYIFFEKLAREESACIATAHTMNDNAETVLFRLARGTGPKGLCGIPPVRGPFVRPFLAVTREETEEYCRVNGLSYAVDSTNLDPRYSRNRIRLQLLPLMEQAHPGAAEALARLAGDMQDLDAWLQQEAETLLQNSAADGAGYGVAVPELLGCYRAAALCEAPRPVLLAALAKLLGPRVDRAALTRAEAVLAGETGAAELPGRRRIERRKGRIYFYDMTNSGEEETPAPQQSTATAGEDQPLSPGIHCLPGGYRLEVEMREKGEGDEIYEKTKRKDYTFFADYDKIPKWSLLRCRRPGDSFRPRRHTVPLRRWMNEQGIEPRLRATLPVLAVESRILWVWGGGFAEGLAPDDGTKKLLILKMGGEGLGDDDGRLFDGKRCGEGSAE